MNDKEEEKTFETILEKINDALEIGLNYASSSGWTRHKDSEVLEICGALDILKELKKSSSYQEAVVSFLFKSYAESYHAKKCAECISNGEKSPCDFCVGSECDACPTVRTHAEISEAPK